MLKIAFSPLNVPNQNALVLTVAADQKLGAQGTKLNQKWGGVVKRAMSASAFNGAKEQTLTIMVPAKSRLTRLVLVGIGDPTKANELVWQRIGGAVCAA